jgi:hypothetical protein
VFSRVSFLILSGILFCIHSPAQEIVVRGRFQKDTVKIGERIPYSFSVHYPSSRSVVFPDSTFSFAPFELEKKTYFPTRTNHHISVDSAVYFLATYELDSVQSLSLPVFVLQRNDCTAVYTQPDTLFVNTLVKAIPESVAAKDLPLKSNADYLSVHWLLNYPLLLLTGGVLIVLLIVVWIVFGRKIRRYFLLRRLNKNHQDFLQRFGRHLEKLRKESAYTEAESALVDWKKYMESLVARPYTKFTTKEILQFAADETLGQALHAIDRMVYARDGNFSQEAFERLRSFSQDQFTKKTEEVKHG